MLQDPISDMLTRIRNAQMARHDSVFCYASKFERAILSLLKDEGYIESFSSDKGKENEVTVVLRYYQEKPVITFINRVSKPGLRIYKAFKDIKDVCGGLGIAIISTSKGLMTGSKAKELKLGGEIICQVA